MPGSIIGSASALPAGPNAPAKHLITGLAPSCPVRRSRDGRRDPHRPIPAFGTPRITGRPGLRFGVSGDWRGELAPYPAIANADERNLDLFIRLGDTIYGDFASPDVFMPQCVSLDEYRSKHQEVYSPRYALDTWNDLARAMLLLATIDDHEVTNDFSGGAFTTDPLFRPVAAAFETPQLTDDRAGGFADADDPAIWTNSLDATQSRVICVAKNGDIGVYDLEARFLLQTVAPDPASVRYNNVDILRGVAVGRETIDIAVVSDRLNDRMVFFRIDPTTGFVSDITDPELPRVFPEVDVAEQETVYGVAAWTSDAGQPYAFVSMRKNSLVLIYLARAERRPDRLGVRGDIDLPGTPSAPLSPENPQVEGMVADEANDAPDIGQEQVGFLRTNATRRRPTPTLVDRVRDFGGPQGPGTWLTADVEVYDGRLRRRRWRPVGLESGRFDLCDDDRVTNAKVGRFAIGGGTIDAVEECDGAAVSTNTFGGIWPGGLLVVQDGNDLPAVLGEDDGEIVNLARSFKFVSYLDVRNAALAPAERVNQTARTPTACRPSRNRVADAHDLVRHGVSGGWTASRTSIGPAASVRTRLVLSSSTLAASGIRRWRR